jgi:hypothetical protein
MSLKVSTDQIYNEETLAVHAVRPNLQGAHAKKAAFPRVKKGGCVAFRDEPYEGLHRKERVNQPGASPDVSGQKTDPAVKKGDSEKVALPGDEVNTPVARDCTPSKKAILKGGFAWS